MKIAITGNIGSGKSTYSKMLKEALPEYQLYSVDDLVHGLYKDTIFCQELEKKFGTSVKAEVSDIVFANADHRKWLEEACAKRVKSQIDYILSGYFNVIVEFPLLFEYSSQLNYEHVITVYCDEATQMERVRTRNNFSDEKINSIIGVQLSTEIKKALAHEAIDSDCSMEDLQNKANETARRIRARDLRNRFFRHDAYTSNREMPLWNAIEKAYSEPHRGYHVLAHLALMFYHFDKIRHKLKYPKIIELAIWYHDLVYNTDGVTYGMNEVNSVKRMFELYATHLGRNFMNETENDIPVLAAAGEFILATKGHEIKSQYILSRPDLKRDCQVFLDLDLAILFQDELTVEWFEQGVQKEFKQYDHHVYANGRAEAMSKFLNRERVMLSDLFADKEEACRATLNEIVSKWEFLGGI